MTDLFTVVIGVDKKHLDQLRIVMPTWKKNKPEIFSFPWIIFYDRMEVYPPSVRSAVQPYTENNTENIKLVPWPPSFAEYTGGDTKWENAERARMLSGFVHVPAQHVTTPYWMKIDTDVVATEEGAWYESEWFEEDHVIIGHPWGYTRPPHMILQLDEWVKNNDYKLSVLTQSSPLNLVPIEGHVKLRHRRIASWVCFFHTEFTKYCSAYAEKTCGVGQMPCHSQDGYMFYVAKRLGYSIVRENMKTRGWTHRNSMKGIRELVERTME